MFVVQSVRLDPRPLNQQPGRVIMTRHCHFLPVAFFKAVLPKQLYNNFELS